MLTKAKIPTDGIEQTGNGSVWASGRMRILIMATKHAEKPPGVPLDLFIAAVDAIADLRDTGKAVVFLRGNGAVRIVGLSPSEAEFAQQLSERLEGVVPSSSEVQKTLAEIERFLSVILASENGTEAAKRLLYSLLKEFQERSEIDPGNPAHEHVLKKVKAAGKLVTDALKDRLLRFRSVTIPTLEELDAELVRQRHDRFTGKHVDVPFLRLRLRYSDRIGSWISDFPFFLWDQISASPKSFELECDLSDLDLLQQRLGEARQMLLDASAVKEVGDDKK
jgi:hypothetical protein